MGMYMYVYIYIHIWMDDQWPSGTTTEDKRVNMDTIWSIHRSSSKGPFRLVPACPRGVRARVQHQMTQRQYFCRSMFFFCRARDPENTNTHTRTQIHTIRTLFRETQSITHVYNMLSVEFPCDVFTDTTTDTKTGLMFRARIVKRTWAYVL